ncbi:MAG: hypothetical protein P8J55_13295 [Pseudomonadales bacterium]|jgi:hypothetical protein|nr:hypothetical protein [Pseudomonadales bacterium]
MSENLFIDGLIVKAPHRNAPDFVKAKLSIKREEMIGWLQQQSGEWINADIKESRAGKWYAAIDNWKPDPDHAGGGAPSSDGNPPPGDNPPPADYDDDIPF